MTAEERFNQILKEGGICDDDAKHIKFVSGVRIDCLLTYAELLIVERAYLEASGIKVRNDGISSDKNC